MELREFLFLPLKEKVFSFQIRAQQAGVFSGAAALGALADELGLKDFVTAAEGEAMSAGTAVFSAVGDAETVSRAEEMLLGAISKPSGVATAAADFVRRGEGVQVVCGAWKKLNPAVRKELRQAVVAGGAGLRMTEEPFVYLDKNYIRMFGGVGPAVERAKQYEPGRLVVAQLRGETATVAVEAEMAVRAGAAILMVDTGSIEDFRVVATAVDNGGWRRRVKLAFAGGVTAEQLAELAGLGAEIVDVGRAILDAPLLDFSLDVEGER